MMKEVTPEDYKSARGQRGNQQEVAALLGVTNVTLSRRERGDQKITREAELALLSLPLKKKPGVKHAFS